MRSYFLFICFMLLQFTRSNAYGQERRKLYFLIDTLASYAPDRGYGPLFSAVHGSDYEEYPAELLEEYSRGKGFVKGRAAFTVEYEAPDDVRPLNIGVPVDDKGSYMWLKNVQLLPDTVRIEKWIIYRNCLADSLVGSEIYYHGDSIRKVKRIQRVAKTRCNEVLADFAFVLNGKLYRSLLTKVDLPPEVCHAHRIRWRNRNGSKVGRKIARRINTETITYRKGYEGFVDVGK